MSETTTEKINKYLYDEAVRKREEHKIEPNVFYPSSCGQCIRKMYFERMTPKVFPPQMYKYFVIGNLTHEWLQKNIYSDGQNEVPIKWTEGDIIFSGRVDCRYPDRVLEFKSIGKLDYVRKKPKDEHVEQLNMYLHAMKIERGVVIYITKNELEVVEHEILYNPKLYKKTVAKFKRLYWYTSKGVEPKITKCGSPWSCEYCKKEKETNSKIN